MFFGADQFKNHVGNNVIIKCHKCGDTNLRYVDTTRSSVAGSGYICGNGHETGGSLDDYGVFGQADTLGSNVNDCCCEGNKCNFPEQIYVRFQGIEGVQAKEACTTRIIDELTARGTVPIKPPCGPNCTVNRDGINGPWTVSCGCEYVSGPCQISTNSVDIPSERFYASPNNTNLVQEFAQYVVQTQIPAQRSSLDQNVNYAVRQGTWLPPTLNNQIPCRDCNPQTNPPVITPGFFADGYPEGYRQYTAGLITEVPGTVGNTWTNFGESIFFYIKNLIRVEYDSDETTCKCLTVKTTINVIIRTHPAVNPTDDLPQFTFSEPSDEGIAEPEIIYTCGNCQQPSFDPGWDGIDGENAYPVAKDFCNLSNLDQFCVNCNSSFGPIVATNCAEDDYSTFWPYRIPTRYTAQVNPTDGLGDPPGHQYFLRNLNGMDDVPVPGECDCNGGSPNFCYETVPYPKCLEVANVRCSDEDAKYRIPCKDPDDSFIVTAETNPDDSVLAYRYDIANLSNYAGFDTLYNLSVVFEPIWISTNGPYDFWAYPPHPNPECRKVSSPGFIYGRGDNSAGTHTPHWDDTSVPFPLQHIKTNELYYPPTFGKPNGHTYGAVGVGRANMAVLLGDDRFKWEQPHCTRRVKNPDLDRLGYPFYMVYTGDISRQTIVLDRYYPTGGSYDFLWGSGQELSVDGVEEQAFIKNRGDIGLSDNSAFPYPFIAKSGSLQEPEIIAIIHSESGVGGQVAFQTFPVAYDSDILLDPYYYKDTDYIDKGLCSYKTRVTVHGYGVMYPLLDDPFWSETKNEQPPANYDGSNYSGPKKIYEYPIVIPGKNYEIGDKIEFRCWKTLKDSESRFDSKDGNPIPSGEEEKIEREECIETIVATATVTELNDERLPPSKVDQNIGQAKITVTVIDKEIQRYHETYQLENVTIEHTGTGYNIDDTINITFSDSGTLDGIHYDTQPYVTVTATGLNGKIENISVSESGEFYKIIRTGGLRWYEFDEEDSEGNSLISIGNCPCSYDLCTDSQDCNGCASKFAYPTTGHNKLNSSPFNYNESITAKEIRTYFGPPYYKPYVEIPPEDAEGCATDPSVTENPGVPGINPDQLINLTCNPDGGSYDCNSSCDSRYGGVDCPDNCSCDSNENCNCFREIPNGLGETFIGGWTGRSDFPYCWPLNNTWEFPQYPENYGLSACWGTPVDPGHRPYIDGHIVQPHKRPQYKYIWKPNPTAFIDAVDTIIPENLTSTPVRNKAFINRLKDEFLSIEGCNPLMLDRFGKSYKFIDHTGEKEYTGSPCRKTNSDDPVPPGVVRTLDDYCRVYGFYQQRKPSCNVIYRGQYIMRAAQKFGFGQNSDLPVTSCNNPPVYADGHTWTDCEPVVGDITIELRQIESQFDLSFGAPYSQDILIPEQLPEPRLGPDGKYEVTADAWNLPSLTGIDNTRFFDHGFYEPNRYQTESVKVLPENQLGETEQGEPPTTIVQSIDPVFNMPDVDGQDYIGDEDNEPIDFYFKDQWDLPDPRSNCRPGVIGIECEDPCLNPEYGTGVGLPVSGIRNDLRSECPYPWEKWGDNSSNTNDIDYFCMFANNSAEVVVAEIEDCEECIGTRIVRSDYVLQSNLSEYPSFFWYTDKELVSIIVDENYGFPIGEVSILFRCFGNFNQSDATISNAFRTALTEYKNFFNDYYDVGPQNLLNLLFNDDHRSIFWNMVFQGASNDKLEKLTKVDIFLFTSGGGGSDPGGGYGGTSSSFLSGSIEKLFSEYRCDNYQRTGTIKSLNVQSGGSNYAFEIEERVPLTGVVQNINDGLLTVDTAPKDAKRRRETYKISQVDIQHSGVGNNGYAVNDIITIKFNDKDYRRGKVFIKENPTVLITEVNDSGNITDWTIQNSGEFYKYVGTDEHRGFPIAMVLNNYWDHTDGSQNFGRHAKLRPVIGVDKTDMKTYGKIKRVEIDFGGVDYVMPGKQWQIQTSTAEYDSYGNPLRGLDIQHLVDPCKHKILSPEGLNARQVTEAIGWQGGPLANVDTPAIQSFYQPADPAKGIQESGDRFTTSIKHYVRTQPNGAPVKWTDKVEGWTNVIGSGLCPMDSGNLLDRTYKMALIEENQQWNDMPHQGNCTTSECNNLIDYDGCFADISPNDPNVPDCSNFKCPVFTSYDAHRYNIAHTNIPNGTVLYDVYASFPPYMMGCSERIDMNYTQAKFYCYDISNIDSGGALEGKGFREYRHINSSRDRCSNAEYSNYFELGGYYTPNQKDLGVKRFKTISYSMGSGPIQMTISYDKDSIPTNTGICPSGSWDGLTTIESGLANICGCEEN
jgi:hypothetical protein